MKDFQGRARPTRTGGTAHAPYSYHTLAPLRAAVAVLFLLGGAHASGVDPTRISLPKGPGSLEGLATADFAPSMACLLYTSDAADD